MLTITQDGSETRTVYRCNCQTCGFTTAEFSDSVWASVVGRRHRCST